MKKKWWHDTIGYQIYPKSFQDTNGDGIGDLKGVIRHLDDIAWLGANVIWLCPVYASPMVDNGYDISDYMGIDPSFGTMEDMKELIGEADKRGIKILMDLVVNHSSDQHAWFRKALCDPYGEYGRYYVFRKGKDGNPPNNWRSIFGGSAWEKVEGWEDLYYLHIFTKEQPDLNWEDPKLREEIYQMIRKWMDMGLGGFRLDAISHLKKNYAYEDLPPDGPDGYNLAFDYINNVDGLAAILREMKERCFLPTDALTIGEYDQMKPEEVEAVIGEDGNFCSVFDFSHTFHEVYGDKWKGDTVALFNDYRDKLFEAQRVVSGRGMLCNFLENHDKPRCIDRFLAEEDRNPHSIRMLPVTNFFFPGIVFLYQGQEIGMRNYPKERLEEYVDKPTYAIYDRLLMHGKSPEEAIEELNRSSREHSRTPMQWNGEKGGGFSEARPWFAMNPDHVRLNYGAQREDPESLLYFYRRMVAVRKRSDLEDAFIYGSFLPRYEEEDGILAYERREGDVRILVLTSVRREEVALPFEDRIQEVLLDNYDREEDGEGIFAGKTGRDPAGCADRGEEKTLVLKPYQCLVLRLA